MPSFAGDTTVFGYSVTITHEMNPSAEQVNAFFGVQGTQSLFGGLRGRVFLIQGVFFGETLSDLNAVEANFLSYFNGVADVLVDTRGRAWPFVLLKPCQPQGRVLQDSRGFYQPYKAGAMGLI